MSEAGKDTYKQFQALVGRIFAARRRKRTSSDRLDLRDSASGLVIQVREDLPDKAYRQLVTIDLPTSIEGQRSSAIEWHFGINSWIWRTGVKLEVAIPERQYNPFDFLLTEPEDKRDREPSERDTEEPAMILQGSRREGPLKAYPVDIILRWDAATCRWVLPSRPPG